MIIQNVLKPDGANFIFLSLFGKLAYSCTKAHLDLNDKCVMSALTQLPTKTETLNRAFKRILKFAYLL